jgi:hypothetical protein
LQVPYDTLGLKAWFWLNQVSEGSNV